MRKTFLIVCITLISAVSNAVQLADIFSDNLVLQRDKPVAIWGTGEPGEKVVVQFNRQKVQAKVDDHKSWKVYLKPMAASAVPRDLIISGITQKTIKNVVVGEVWFCSGQSNMVWTLKQIETPITIATTMYNPLLRMETEKGWVPAKDSTIMNFSATALYFGDYLYRSLKVPVGLIVRARGGSPIEPWTSREVYQSNPVMQAYLNRANQEDVLKAEREYSIAIQAYLKVYRQWEKASEEERKSIQLLPAPVMPDVDIEWGPFLQSGNLYNSLVKPVMPYTIRGITWYQGESNARIKVEAIRYRELLPVMIQSWREDWNDSRLPFIQVQLPNWDTGNSWSWLRESQYQVTLQVPKTYMAVAIDIGGADLHPKNKKEIGRRLGLIALDKVYGKRIVSSGPVYENMKIDQDKMILSFKNSGSGLMAKGDILKGFKVAAEDKDFLEADASILKNKVVLRNPTIAHPVAVRYGWEANPNSTLYNREGLPAMPFRTDTWND